MTKEPSIEDIIEDAESSEGSGVYIFDKEPLTALLEQVQREQRDICAEQYKYGGLTNDTNGFEIRGVGLKDAVYDSIRNAPPAWRES